MSRKICRDSNIWRLDVEPNGKFGKARRIIASTRLDSSPQFSPDGRSIVFVFRSHRL